MMDVVETQWWTMLLPPEWSAEEDGDDILVSDIDEVGVLEISCIKKESGSITEEDLQQFTGDLVSSGKEQASVETDFFEGSYFEYLDDGEWCRDWFLINGDLLIIAGYTCMEEDKRMDDASVDELVGSIAPILEDEQSEE
ncbi:MAG: hypothetical protein ACI90U_003068 [Pseudomonadales bacterium]|jgi:hypothetical protein